MRYNTIIFDLDGTLLNTLDDLRDSLNVILIKEGYLPRTIEDVKRFVGNGVSNLVRRALPESCEESEVIRIMNQFKEHYKKNMQNKTRPYDGIPELLEELRNKHYKTAIVSNKFDPAVKALSKLYFGNLVQIAVGETEGIKRKPAPDCVFTAVKELDSDLGQSILVGDSETDVQTAKNAGIPCVGVTWGFRSREILIKEGADYLIDLPEELLHLI